MDAKIVSTLTISEMKKIGIVYRLTIGDYYYTGSTTETIYNRILNHKRQFREDNKYSKERKVYKHIAENGGWDAVKVSILETEVSADKLLQKENSYINLSDPFCLNSVNAFREVIEVNRKNKNPKKAQRDKEYYEANKEILLQKRRERYLKDIENPEKKAIILKQTSEAQKRYALKKESVVCECGRTITPSNLSSHKKSKIHNELLEKKAGRD